jgi:hypothetical protein
MEDRMSSSHKDVPEYDETVVCENPECKHLEAPAITGLYGIAGGGGLGVYSVCENCGTVLTKSLDPETCETHNEDIGSKHDAEKDSEPKSDLDK